MAERVNVRLAVGFVRLRRLVERAVPVPEEWQRRLCGLRERIGLARPVRLVASAATDAPLTLGWLRPLIVLPIGVLGSLAAAPTAAPASSPLRPRRLAAATPAPRPAGGAASESGRRTGHLGHPRQDHLLGLPPEPHARRDPPGLFPGPGSGGVSQGLDRQRDRTLAGGESPPLDDAALCAPVLEVLRSEPEREDYRELPAIMEAGVVSAAQHREADEQAQGKLRGRRAAADRTGSRGCGGGDPRLRGSVAQRAPAACVGSGRTNAPC